MFEETPNIIQVTKSGRVRRAGHVARTGRGEMHTGLWWGNLREKKTYCKTQA